LANPVFAAPDEPAHVIRAHALDHGQLTGREPAGRIPRELRPVETSARVVRAPEIYRPFTGPPCFALQQGEAFCLNVVGPTGDVDVVTYEALQPPAYYAMVGVVTRVVRPGGGTVYAMRFMGALISGAFIATAITASRRMPSRRLLATGLALAVTPMVLFMSSVVNPNGPEIAASLAFWACGLALVSIAHERIDNRLVTAVGLAGCVLALSRQLGPLWLALIVLTVLGVTSRAALTNLARSRLVRLWTALIAASVAAQVAWGLIVRPRDATLVDQAPSNRSSLEAAQEAFGSTLTWYREMVGWFGWRDTQAPVLTWLPWLGAIAFIFLVALAWSNRRYAAMLIALLASVIAVPVIIEATPYRTGTFWQGRFTLPLAVGIPILAAFALASTQRAQGLVNSRFALTIGVVVGVAQVLAFAQNLRRYTVGYDGEIQYWKDPHWPPPLSPLLLTVAFAAVVTAFTAWLLWPARMTRRPLAESSTSQATREAPGV
jgi:Predicted membrane protein (DUF2142)